MKKILIPTDFSPNAHHAFLYGLELGKALNAQVRVIHFCRPGIEDFKEVPSDGIDSLIDQKKKKLQQFVQEDYLAPSMNRVVEKAMVDMDIKVGSAEEELVALSKTNIVDLIVMGTTGEGSLLKKMFGSVSSAVSQKAHCPVLLVPPGENFKGIENILYASNYQAINTQALHEMIDFAQNFEANIHLVHIEESGKKGDVQLEELVLERLIDRKMPGADLKITTVQSESVWEGLSETAVNCKADLMVLVTRHRKFWESIRHKSQTREMIKHAELPLLILHVDDK